MATTTSTTQDQGWLPPRHRPARLDRASSRPPLHGGRRGLKLARPGKEGYLRLRTVGRRSGCERGHPGLLRGWAEPRHDGDERLGGSRTGLWLNLLAHPEAEVDQDGTRRIRARAAEGAERDRLWAQLDEHNGWGASIDAYATRRSRETAVVVFEPIEEGPQV